MTQSEIERIADGLSEEQQAMLIRGSGKYHDSGEDMLKLFTLEIYASTLTPLGQAVRKHIMEKQNG